MEILSRSNEYEYRKRENYINTGNEEKKEFSENKTDSLSILIFHINVSVISTFPVDYSIQSANFTVNVRVKSNARTSSFLPPGTIKKRIIPR